MNGVDYEKRKAELIEEITVAFDGVSREGGVSLHEAEALDAYGSQKQLAAARALDTEKEWQQVPDEDLRTHDSALSFLDPIGFHYYIPAFMVWDLRNIDNSDPEYWSNSFDSLDFYLGVAYNDRIDPYFHKRLTHFTPKQRKAVARFLLLLLQRELSEPDYEGQCWFPTGFSTGEFEAAVKQWRGRYGKPYEPQNNIERALNDYWAQYL